MTPHAVAPRSSHTLDSSRDRSTESNITVSLVYHNSPRPTRRRAEQWSDYDLSRSQMALWSNVYRMTARIEVESGPTRATLETHDIGKPRAARKVPRFDSSGILAVSDTWQERWT